MTILHRASHLPKIPLAKNSLEHGYDELWVEEEEEDEDKDDEDLGEAAPHR